MCSCASTFLFRLELCCTTSSLSHSLTLPLFHFPTFSHSPHKYTALHFACFYGDIKSARGLIERGADPSITASDGMTKPRDLILKSDRDSKKASATAAKKEALEYDYDSATKERAAQGKPTNSAIEHFETHEPSLRAILERCVCPKTAPSLLPCVYPAFLTTSSPCFALTHHRHPSAPLSTACE